MEKPTEKLSERDFNSALNALKASLNTYLELSSEQARGKKNSPGSDELYKQSFFNMEKDYRKAIEAGKMANLPNPARQVYFNFMQYVEEIDPQTRNHPEVKTGIAMILLKVGVEKEDLNALYEPEVLEKDIADRILKGEGQRILRNAGLEESDLRNKRVLDIGAGGRFLAGYCAEHNISEKIYSLDPHIGKYPVDRKFLETNFPDIAGKVNERTVVAKKEGIPFEDNAFDYALMSGVFRTHVRKDGVYLPLKKKEIQRTLEEALRILKKNGEARISSLAVNEKNKAGNEILFEVLKEYEANGICSVSIETLPKTSGIRLVMKKL